MRPTMPGAAAEIVETVRKLAGEGVAAELAGGNPRQPMAFVDIYRAAGGPVAHVVYYGDGQPDGFRLRVAPWLANARPVLYSPHLSTSLPLAAAAGGWIELPRTFGRYCAVRFG